jgi:hypothetical protein
VFRIGYASGKCLICMEFTLVIIFLVTMSQVSHPDSF